MFHIANKLDLVAFFNHYVSVTRAIVVTRTPVRLNKKDTATKTTANPYDAVYKVQGIEADINQDYQSKVNDARLLEGQLDRSFQSQDRKWGVHVNKAIVEKDEKFYLNVIEIKKIGNVRYELEDGTPVTYEAIQPFFPPYNGSVKQNLEDEVKVRSFKLENIVALNIDNKVQYLAS